MENGSVSVENVAVLLALLSCTSIPDKLVGVFALCKKPCTVPAGICCVFQWQLTQGGINSISVFWGNNEKLFKIEDAIKVDDLRESFVRRAPKQSCVTAVL